MVIAKHIYNYKKGPVSENDHNFHIRMRGVPLKLPTSIDLRKSGFMPEVLAQGNLGSCTANATSNALEFCLKKEKTYTVFRPSRLYIYYFTRFLEDNVDEDTGCCIKDVMKELYALSCCPETMWPYDITKFTVRPSRVCIKEARKHLDNLQYMAVDQDLYSLRSCLALKFPIVFGVAIYESFQSDISYATGEIPMPNTETEKFLGGHCILMCGYDDLTQRFIFQNSWGTDVGDKGFFTIPYEYILNPNLAYDFWTISVFD
jgi:C1A family cysteine protease